MCDWLERGKIMLSFENAHLDCSNSKTERDNSMRMNFPYLFSLCDDT